MIKINMSKFACNLIICTVLIHLPSLASASRVYNVLKFGAEPNGLKDSSKSFLGAWNAACSTFDPAIIMVPKGRYLLHPINFHGRNCKSNDITFLVDGTLVLPFDFRVLGNSDIWLGFERVTGVSFVGDGFLNARGSALWACKEAGDGRSCPDGATTLTFTNSNNIVIKGITTLNSQLYHIVINNCMNVNVEGVKIRATGSSPNTDGIHVQLSMNVKIINSFIKTGDDCISIGPGTKNLWIERVACGPGHGISIGSLAKDMHEEGVQNVTVKTVVLAHTTNGLRIKSWGRPSKGFVRGVIFDNVLMHHVSYPIIIDQNYCPYNLNCPGQGSGVRISDVKYRNIRGTSATKVAVKFDCSPSTPCTEISLHDISLTYLNGAAKSSCNNAAGMCTGLVQPKSCFN